MKIESITYAGHSATFVSCAGFEIAIDPWLGANPSCPDKLKTPQKLDLIILTHAHADHASEAPALAKRLGSSVLATWELAAIMGQEGVAADKIIAMNKGGTFDFKGLKITLTHAMHSSSYDTKNGAVYAGEACGVVLHNGKQSIYHAGDTALFSDMPLIAQFYKPQIALLPIGDRFSMGPKEAAYAAKLLKVRSVIPIHYGTFDFMPGTLSEFQEAMQGNDIEIAGLKPGESLNL